MTITTESTDVRLSRATWANPHLANDPAYAEAFSLWVSGKPWEVITEATGVGYASGWLFCIRTALVLNEPEALVDLGSMSRTQAANRVAEMRLDDGDSWGRIMARTGVAEGQVRKLFTEKTNVYSEGLRNGKGGRFYQGNAEAYDPAPKVGWVRKAEASAELPAQIIKGLLEAGSLEGGDVAELEGMSLKDLKSLAKSFGLPTSGKKVDLVARVAQAYAA